MIENKDILDGVIQVNSSSGGFYNPSKADKMGLFYLSFNEGNPKGISFKYDGSITLNLAIAKARVRHYELKKTIIINFEPDCQFEDDLIFRFTGNLKYVKGIKIHNWRGRVVFPRFINYDQTNVYLNYSKTNLEDDSILIEDDLADIEFDDNITTPRIKTHAKLSRSYRTNLPENYIVESDKQELNQFCKTCSYWKTKYCELWKEPVLPLAWCESWMKKGIK